MRNLGARGNYMPKKPKPKPDDALQSQQFVETAKQLEADKEEKSFEQALNAVVAPKSRTPDQRPKRQ